MSAWGRIVDRCVFRNFFSGAVVAARLFFSTHSLLRGKLITAAHAASSRLRGLMLAISSRAAGDAGRSRTVSLSDVYACFDDRAGGWCRWRLSRGVNGVNSSGTRVSFAKVEGG